MMKLSRFLRLCVPCAFFALAAPASAADDLQQCLETADTTRDMSACTGAQLTRDTEQLTQAWKQALRAAGGSKTEIGNALLQEQRAWIAHKDTVCERFYDMEQHGSAGRALSAPTCLSEFTTERTEYLRRLPPRYSNKYSLKESKP
ncbi:lysozyme inhibitor LprI family protein [Pacificimonas sp. ICDLI1SI03]